MSIIINGVEMPTRCWDCLLNTYGYCMASDKHSDIIPSDAPIPDWCPLVPVPPHGRLIDADAELERLKHCMFPSDMVTTTAVGMYEEWLKKAPAIIPASTADKEGEG